MTPIEGGEGAPLWAQFALGVAGLGSFLGMVAAAFKPKKEEVVSTARTVTESVSMVNDKPFRDSFEHIEAFLRRVADNTDILVMMERKRIEEDERRQLRAEARIEAQERETIDRLNDRLGRIERAERSEREREKREHGGDR